MDKTKTSGLVYIKNMVCNRCITAVEDILAKSDIKVLNVQLGEVTLPSPLAKAQREQLARELAKNGFELLDDARQKLIDKIKTSVIEYVNYDEGDHRENFSHLLAGKLYKDYSYLSKLFSETEGITIEKYLINQKIEKVKELMMYGELNLSEIAFQLGYSSVAHLSAQFKRATGFSPSNFRRLPGNKRKTLDNV